MKYFFVLISLFFNVWNVYGQFERNYITIPFQDTIPPEILTRLKQRLEYDKAKVDGPKAQVNYMKSLYDERYKYVVESFNKDYFITKSTITDYLQHVLNTIYKANPGLARETTVYPFRSSAPNAISFGDGTIGFTLGLLSIMENESQIAFVLCHELAHYHARHSDLNITELGKLNSDKEIKKKLKDIQKSDYGQYTKLKNLYSGLGLSITSHSRGHEFEADSIGLIYYRRTGYKADAPIRTMEILDSADISRHKEIIDLKKFFSFKEYPFRDSWLTYATSTMWHAPVTDLANDSMQTHPSCKKRGVALKRQIELSPIANLSLISDAEKLTTSRIQSEFEMIETNYHFKRYGRALFLAMVLEPSYPENAYLHAMISRCMYQLYQHQKNHALGKVLEMPDSNFDENYDRVLAFIHNLRLQEIASLAYYYMINQREEFFNNEEFLYSFWLCSQLPGSNVDPNKIKLEYKTKFPTGKYNYLIK